MFEKEGTVGRLSRRPEVEYYSQSITQSINSEKTAQTAQAVWVSDRLPRRPLQEAIDRPVNRKSGSSYSELVLGFYF